MNLSVGARSNAPRSRFMAPMRSPLSEVETLHEPGVWCPPFRVSVGPEHAKAWTPNRTVRFMVQCMRESERGLSINLPPLAPPFISRSFQVRFRAFNARRLPANSLLGGVGGGSALTQNASTPFPFVTVAGGFVTVVERLITSSFQHPGFSRRNDGED